MPRTRSGRSRSSRMRSRGLLTELLGHPARESGWRLLAGWLIRARAEITVLLVLAAGYGLLKHWTGWSAHTMLIVETVTVVVIICVPGTRARMWAVLDRHRVWKCFLETRTMTPNGTMPYLLWARPSPVGERIRVSLPAGLSVNDLDQITEALAAACYAREARVEVNRHATHLVTILITRRDPFTAKSFIRPRLAAWLPKIGKPDGFRPLPDRDIFAASPYESSPADLLGWKDQPNRKAGRATSTRRRTTPAPGGGKEASDTATTTNPEPVTPPPVVGVGGMDVSDYV